LVESAPPIVLVVSAPVPIAAPVSVVAGAGDIVDVVSVVMFVESVVDSLELPPQAAKVALIAKTNKSFFIVVNVFMSEF
jgi:hypothetical protein